MVDWDSVAACLHSYPEQVNLLRPPCPPERIKEVEARLGNLPASVLTMLRTFNGGELFNRCGPLVTIFGLSLPNDPPDLDWYIDRFTAAWRPRIIGPTGWVIGIMNYGAVFVINDASVIREWDSAQQQWSRSPRSVEEWLNWLFAEGDVFLSEN